MAVSTGAARGRSLPTFRDMFWSLVVVLGVLALVLALLPKHRAIPPQAIDYTSAVSDLAGVAPYTVVAPKPLPDGWIATSARVGLPAKTIGGAATLDLGLHFDDGKRYVVLAESNGPADAFVADRAGQGSDIGSDVGSVSIAGRTWRQVRSDGGALSLVGTYPQALTVVVGGAAGNATLVDLERLVATLEPAASVPAASGPTASGPTASGPARAVP